MEGMNTTLEQVSSWKDRGRGRTKQHWENPGAFAATCKKRQVSPNFLRMRFQCSKGYAAVSASFPKLLGGEMSLHHVSFGVLPLRFLISPRVRQCFHFV